MELAVLRPPDIPHTGLLFDGSPHFLRKHYDYLLQLYDIFDAFCSAFKRQLKELTMLVPLLYRRAGGQIRLGSCHTCVARKPATARREAAHLQATV
jgi:hypothetical protein